MSEHDSHFYSQETGEKLGERLTKLFEGLDEKEIRNVFEELIDDYCQSHYNVSIVNELRRLKFASKGQTFCLQPLANGRAILLSSYGFKIKSQSECKCGRAFIVLDEKTREDFDKERENER